MSWDDDLLGLKKPDRVQTLTKLACVGSTGDLHDHALVVAASLAPNFPHEGSYITGPGRWAIKGEVVARTAAAALATLVEFYGRVIVDPDQRETLARYLEHVAAGLRRWPPDLPED